MGIVGFKCNKCESLGLKFLSENVSPEEYIEGNPDGRIWIIGLNPRGKIGTIEMRSKKEFQSFDPDTHKYFHSFKKVSEKLYSNWKSANNNIAHTDLVKCFSPTFPPMIDGRPLDRGKVISNCKTHLLTQIKKHKPKIVICNGSDVCREMIRFFPPDKTTEQLHALTAYLATDNDDEGKKYSFWVILSGFIGRIDNRNKRRLGKEIEALLDISKIKL